VLPLSTTNQPRRTAGHHVVPAWNGRGQLSMRTGPRRDRVLVEIGDNGPGIPRPPPPTSGALLTSDVVHGLTETLRTGRCWRPWVWLGSCRVCARRSRGRRMIRSVAGPDQDLHDRQEHDHEQ
jgi:hypothetical protein